MNLPFVRSIGLPKYLWRRIALDFQQAISIQPVRLRLPTGLSFIVPKSSFPARDAFTTNANVDWGSESLFFKHLDSKGDFIDVGANVGYYSVFGAPVVRQVFSFEPDPRNHPSLEANAALASNILVQKLALSSEAGELLLDVSQDSSLSKFTATSSAAGPRTVAVQATTLDLFAGEKTDLKVTGIKLDTEGHELAILRGGVNTIRRDQPLILTELQRPAGEGAADFQELRAFADALNYRPFAFVPVTPGLIKPAQYRLTELSSEQVFASHPTKMIFLVPKRLHTAFAAG